MIHDILFPVTGTSGDDAALSDAIALASELGAHLSVLHVVNLPAPYVGPLGVSNDYLLADLYGELRRQGDEDVAKLRTRLEREGLSWELRRVETVMGDVPRPLTMHGRYADLSVLPGPGTTGVDRERAFLFFNGFLFDSGRPVLVVPPRHPATFPMKHAVVAWQPTREATRALHDALPLLRRCRSVDIVTIDPQVGATRHGEEPGADIAIHLARHGLRVNVTSLPGGGAPIAAVLLRHCAETGAQLLVSGGYGHARAREWVLGGVTLDLLESLTLPVLFSH
jgi:nucleotide-binding universal stress UspA family protein